MASDLISGKVGLPARIGFGVGDLAFNLIWQGTALFLMYFYTDVVGIAPAAAGAIYLAAMVWDAVTDPLVATLADRTRTRWGRYRPWIFFGAVPLSLTYPLAFSTSPAPELISPILWALVTHIALRTAYTVVGVPFSSLQARLTQDAQERTVLAGFRMFGAASGGLTVVFVTPVLVSAFGPDQEAEAYLAAAGLAGAICLAALAFCLIAMKEPAETGEASGPAVSILDDLKSIGPMFIRNPPLIRVFAIIITASVCLAMFSKNILYFFKYNLDRPELTLWALTLPAFSLFVMIPVWVALAGRTSKRTALSLGCGVALLGYLVFLSLPASDPAPVFAAIILIGLGGSALPVMFWSMLPDTVEYGEARMNVRAEAKTFGFATFAQKAALGINALLLGLLLAGAGFEPNAEQGEGTLLAIKLIMAGVPALGIVIILLVLRGYDIDRAHHARLRAQIAAAKAN